MHENCWKGNANKAGLWPGQVYYKTQISLRLPQSFPSYRQHLFWEKSNKYWDKYGSKVNERFIEFPQPLCCVLWEGSVWCKWKPREELAPLGSLCLPAGIFASHPCQAKRHPCLLHFGALCFAFFLNRDKTVKYFPSKSHMWSPGPCIPSNCHFLRLTFAWPPSPRRFPIPLFLHLSLVLSQVSASVTGELDTLLENPVEMLGWKTGQNLPQITQPRTGCVRKRKRSAARIRPGGETWILRVSIKCFMNIVKCLRPWKVHDWDLQDFSVVTPSCSQEGPVHGEIKSRPGEGQS